MITHRDALANGQYPRYALTMPCGSGRNGGTAEEGSGGGGGTEDGQGHELYSTEDDGKTK